MTRQEYKDIYDVVGAAQEVHKVLGRGLSEAIYQEALAIEMTSRGMEFERESDSICIIRMSFWTKHILQISTIEEF